MLILPPGHAKELTARRSLSVREKRMIAGVLAVVAALAVAFVISLSTSDPVSKNGCIYLTLAANAMTGGEEIHQCGVTARDTCSTSQMPGAFTQEAAREVAVQCRKAGLHVGS